MIFKEMFRLDPTLPKYFQENQYDPVKSFYTLWLRNVEWTFFFDLLRFHLLISSRLVLIRKQLCFW